VLSIVDLEQPEIVCPQNIQIPTNQQTCTATVSYPDPVLFDNCPCISIKNIPGYILMDTFGGHAYYYSIAPTSFVDAAANAILAGGHLLTITSPAEDFFIAANSYFERWIGLSDQAIEGVMQWTNGEAFGYNNFCASPGFQNDPLRDFVFIGQLSCSPDQWAFSEDNVLRQSILEFDYVPIDTCKIELLSGLPSGSEFPYGINTVEWIGYDGSGNKDTCSFRVIVSDGGAPSITCPPAISINCELTPSPANTGNPIVLDNCDPNPTVLFRDELDNHWMYKGVLANVQLGEERKFIAVFQNKYCIKLQIKAIAAETCLDRYKTLIFTLQSGQYEEWLKLHLDESNSFTAKQCVLQIMNEMLIK